MKWNIFYTKDSHKDLKKLDNSQRKQVLRAIEKVSYNPLPSPDGYGKPLGNKGNNNLTNCFKIKLRGIGIRVVYNLVMENNIMRIIVISVREDSLVYDIASERVKEMATTTE
ncbi:type II toxin-antitoxin system RelE family toxin [Clostridioides difficile]|uniref:type II toxin-antitoxin system RelE family toxin n=1 Tax=Clostridioides difficile TaxID=1496 RepID=UPI000BB19808|nr:type II toxin-antitoxin system RelE/ParE family toxin [Clostridioides difficile]PBD80403.1 addiction module toxin RelE [Clostridioides difficile]